MLNDQPSKEGEGKPAAPQPQEEQKPRKRHRSRRRRDRLEKFNFDIPGVVKLVISPWTQKVVGCEVGKNVTMEKPWIYIPKEEVDDHLEMHEESSDFLPVKEMMAELPLTNVLLGYIPDEARGYDEFYMCVSEHATNKVAKMMRRQQDSQARRLKNKINREIGKWTTLGSGAEVDENIVRDLRTLIEVEVEASYPILEPQVKFSTRKVSAVSDGYVELVPGRAVMQNVARKVYDSAVQAAPYLKHTEAQTNPTYPRNNWTQYAYEYDPVEFPEEEDRQKFTDFVQQHEKDILETVTMNGVMDFFELDYDRLAPAEMAAVFGTSTALYTEYFSFADVTTCKNKLISMTAWHQMWSGILAIAYVDAAKCSLLSMRPLGDDVNRAVHGTNPVLIWSFKDVLKPRLHLETPREVFALSFCPFDENILVGGCCNGQIVIWDLKNKLKQVEDEEILTIDQQKYRIVMYSMMGWFKNTANAALVRPTVLTPVEYSHSSCCTQINWIHPKWMITKSGKLMPTQESKGDSMQFMTSSEDGTLLVWDLKSRPIATSFARLKTKVSKRLPKKPSALAMVESHLHIYNRAIKPIFKLHVKHDDELAKPIPICSFDFYYQPVVYEEINPDPKVEFDISNRCLYKPVVTELLDLKFEVTCGTSEGDYIHAKWEGYDFSTGEDVSSEAVHKLCYSRVHDGPILKTFRSPVLKDILLTIGGKIFAIWKEGYNERPILWRRCRGKFYTSGCWEPTEPSQVRLTRSDGTFELWNFEEMSEKPFVKQSISGKTLTDTSTYPFRTPIKVLGMGDYNGTFRIFQKPTRSLSVEAKAEVFRVFIQREYDRKLLLKQWENEWKLRNAESLRVKREQYEMEKRQREEEIIEAKLKQDEIARQLAEEEERRRLMKLRPQPGQYQEWAQERWTEKEQKRMARILLHKRNLFEDDLVMKTLPLQALLEQEERKKRKLKELNENKDKMFEETVAMLFPEGALPSEPSEFDSGTLDPTEVVSYSHTYGGIQDETCDFIESNSYEYSYDWNKVLEMNLGKRKGHRPRKERSVKARTESIAMSDRSVETLTKIAEVAAEPAPPSEEIDIESLLPGKAKEMDDFPPAAEKTVQEPFIKGISSSEIATKAPEPVAPTQPPPVPEPAIVPAEPPQMQEVVQEIDTKPPETQAIAPEPEVQAPVVEEPPPMVASEPTEKEAEPEAAPPPPPPETAPEEEPAAE